MVRRRHQRALSYLPEGVDPDILRYWFPADGKGLVDNDLMVMLRGGKNPVLSHLFLNHMLDPDVAKQNFAQIGYQPPQNNDQPGLAGRPSGFIPANLKTAVVEEDYFNTGYRCSNSTRPMTQPGTTSGGRSRPEAGLTRVAVPVVTAPARAAPPPSRERRAGYGRHWPRPASSGWLLFFIAPLYVVLASCSARSTRSSARPSRCGTRCSGTPPSSPTC